MGWACSAHGEMRIAYILVAKLEEKRPFRRHRRKWEDHIKTHLIEIWMV
jgi:hypothetical protein